jgi:hypothetical protein
MVYSMFAKADSLGDPAVEEYIAGRKKLGVSAVLIHGLRCHDSARHEEGELYEQGDEV